MIWFIMFLALCGTIGCVAILGDGNTVSQHGIELDADTDIDDDSKNIEVEDNDSTNKSTDN